MPDIVFNSRDELPEELRASARDAEGGKVVVNLVANERLKEFRDSNIAVSKERDQFKAIVDQISAQFPEFDPEKAVAEIGELRTVAQRVKDGSLKATDDIEKVVTDRVNAMKTSYEQQIATKGQDLQKLAGRNTILETRLREQAIKQMIVTAAASEKAGVQPSAIDDIVSRALGVFVVENDGERIVPKAGDAILYGSDGTTPMSAGEWIETLKDKSPHLFKQSTGGGGNGGAGEKRFGGFSAADVAAMSPEEKLRIANEASRPRGW